MRKINRRAFNVGVTSSTILGSSLFQNQAYCGLVPSADFEPDIEFDLVAQKTKTQVWKGEKTDVFKYVGEVTSGRKESVKNLPSYLGPTLDFNRGEKVRIRFKNELDEPSIVHWHGLIVPEPADGHPQLSIKPNQEYVYEFEVNNRAGTYWYHPHPHGRTGYQVYYGLGGVFIVRDPSEKSINLPSGTDEHILVIQDRRANRKNQFEYVSAPSDSMMGFLGNEILINGESDKSIKVDRKPNRIRLLNLSNSRVYKFAWSDDSPMNVIGTDGGLLAGDEGPVKKPFIVLGPAERVEIWEDFSSKKANSEVKLISQEFQFKVGMGMGRNRFWSKLGDRNGRGMMRMMRGPGEKLEIATFKISDSKPQKGQLPKLPGKKPKATVADKEYKTSLGFRAMQGFLNGKQWVMDNMAHVDANEIIPLNKTIDWVFDNATEPGMLMPHPMHLHGVQFRIVERKGDGADDLAKGVVDSGLKDTVMVFAGDEVKIQFKPTVPGLFVYHCHNLEHEDRGMMRNFLVK